MSGEETTFVSTNAITFFPVKPQIIALRPTDINIAFTDIRYDNKKV